MSYKYLIPFLLILLLISFFVRANIQQIYIILVSSKLFFQLLIGALVIIFLREIVGIRTFGVFGPIIVAFVFLRSGFFWGLALFGNIFLLASVTRFVLEPLKLGTTFRTGIVAGMVGIYMALAEIIGEFFHIKELEFSILFPILITAWLGDHFINQINERGWRISVITLFWTTVSISITYFVINFDPLILFVIKNPETWVAIIAGIAVVGRKTRFRISEYFRFKPTIEKNKIDFLNSENEILTMALRNREFIAKYNPKKVFPNITKIGLKKMLVPNGIPMAKTLMLISEKRELEKTKKFLKKADSFVIKPAISFGGEGILIIKEKKGEKFITANNTIISLEDIISHIKQILEGQFNQFQRDDVLIEEKIECSKDLNGLYFNGLPDIRLIVFKGFPIMAMARLPTKESKGKANLHAGAIAAGIKISTGEIIHAIHFGSSISKHPDTGKNILEKKIHLWSEVLEISILAAEASNLGYAGVDIVLSEKGPLVLEVNKRPGLEIQNANQQGQLKRLRFIENLKAVPENKITAVKIFDQEGWK